MLAEVRTIGTIHGTRVLSLDANRQPPLWTADIGWSGVDLAQWITLRNGDTKEAKPQPYITGTLSGKAKVGGRGRSTAQILGSLDGQTFMWIRDGTLSHLLVEAMGLDIAQGLGLLVVGDSATVSAHPFYRDFIDYVTERSGYRSAWEE